MRIGNREIPDIVLPPTTHHDTFYRASRHQWVQEMEKLPRLGIDFLQELVTTTILNDLDIDAVAWLMRQMTA